MASFETEEEWLWIRDNHVLPRADDLFSVNGWGVCIGGIQTDFSDEPFGGWEWLTGEPFVCSPIFDCRMENYFGIQHWMALVRWNPGEPIQFNDIDQNPKQPFLLIEWQISDVDPADCNSNGIVDNCELETNDCNANGIPDDCDDLADCNANGIGDVCDIDSGTSIDVNMDGIPDECQCVPDIVADGVVDFTDLLTLLNEYGPCPPPCRSDLNGDGVVNFADILQLLSAWGACE